MPTRSYYFPEDFRHLEEILRATPEGLSEEQATLFREFGVPPIITEGALALFLGISPKRVFSIRYRPHKHYRSFEIRKKDGTKRQIDTPRTYLKVIQWWILDNILRNLYVADNVFGFVQGRNAVDNAAYHFGACHVLNVDIKQFFPSITIQQIKKVFESLGYTEEVSNMLSELCCLNDRLPQGAPTSPSLANQVLTELDRDVSELAAQSGRKYSRYADDLTFSSKVRIEETFVTSISDSVERYGFELKTEKTRFTGKEGRMEVTGVVINDRLQPPRVWRKKTRAKIHNLSNARRLTRKDVAYLEGVKGIAGQFSHSPQMCALGSSASNTLEELSQTVIGKSAEPILPNALTLRQAEVLASLAPRRSNAEMALRLGTTEAAVKKRLQVAIRKIGAKNRKQAMRWAEGNL